MKNVLVMPHITPEFAILIARLKKVRNELKEDSPAFERINKLLQETLRRGY